MGYPLRRWLADRLPAGISSGERLVALEIADWADDETGIAYGKDLLAMVTRRAGYANVKQTRKVLTKLAASGIELRVPIGKNQNGEPIYAYEGKQTTYRIPASEELGFDESVVVHPKLQVDPRKGAHSRQEGSRTAPSGPPVGDERAPARRQEDPPAGAPSPHVSSSTPQRSLSQRPSTSEAMLAALDVDERERDGLIQKIEELNNVKGFGWWLNAWSNDTLAERLTEARAEMAGRSSRAKPPWCGQCDERSRIRAVESMYGGHSSPQRCPECHPVVGRQRQPPPSRPQNNGWDGPYLNPDNPATAYAGYRNDITDEELAADYATP